jgi:hypothetical protein
VLTLNKCPFCGKTFTRERTLQVHMCEPKRRHLQKNEKWVQNAFLVFQRFYQIHQNSTKEKTYDDFCKSAYYNAFVKFGRFMMHVNDTLKVEPVESALQRSIATMMDWAAEQKAQWSDYFRLVNTNRAVQHIQQGKISPWLLLGCPAGKKMLKSFSDEQLQMTHRFISPEYWANKFKSYPADHLFVMETAKEAKIE